MRLKEIPNPPAVIYTDGELPDIDNSVVISMVGTRKASEYAIKVTELMSRGVAQSGAVVVSGGALGVDSASHRGAIMRRQNGCGTWLRLWHKLSYGQ